jgi:H+/gluconate symporter-like permease
MLLLVLVGWVMYPLELLILNHWLESWQSKVPFLLAIPGFVFTVWILFDRETPWVRMAFIITMWVSLIVGLLGAFYHVVWNFDGEVEWYFDTTMEAIAGDRPTLAAMAFTHMGVTGLLSIFRTKQEAL